MVFSISTIFVLVCLIALTAFISSPFVFFSVYAGDNQALTGIPTLGDFSQTSLLKEETSSITIDFKPEF